MTDYASHTSRSRAPLPADPASDLIRYATLAANGHNTQPWRFRVENGAIDILPDLSRATPVVDPDDHHLFVSLGCVIENLVIAAAAAGRPGEVRVDPEGRIRFLYSEGAMRTDPLCAAIPRRQSTRADYDDRPVSATDIETLRKAAEIPGVRLVLLTERTRMNQVRDLIVAGNDAQMRDPA